MSTIPITPTDEMPILKADGYAESYINGNRKSVCQEILAGAGDIIHPAVMAALVTLKLSQMIGIGTAEEFIRILAAQVE